MPSRNLTTMYKEAPANPVIGQDAANDATVGDINSSARGSGARYNVGKPPFDLVPIQMMASYYSVVENAAHNADYDPILALSLLGEFQGGEDGDLLLDLLVNLGDGWEECAQVFDYGRKKYAAWNWSKGMNWSVPIACAARHLVAMIGGEVLDPESGLPHRGHVYCNVAMLYTFLETYEEGDDRPTPGSLFIDLECDCLAETDELSVLDQSALMQSGLTVEKMSSEYFAALVDALIKLQK